MLLPVTMKTKMNKKKEIMLKLIEEKILVKPYSFDITRFQITEAFSEATHSFWRKRRDGLVKNWWQAVGLVPLEFGWPVLEIFLNLHSELIPTLKILLTSFLATFSAPSILLFKFTPFLIPTPIPFILKVCPQQTSLNMGADTFSLKKKKKVLG